MILGTNTSVAQGDADNFYKSNSVNTEKVSFSNQYKMKVGARLFLPKELEEGRKYPAVIVGHPMGAVKEQSAGLYATKLAECGFVTLALDLSFWGESDGEPRNAVLPDVYSEDFSAALWYSRNLTMSDTLVKAPKMFREMDGIRLENVRLPFAQETLWHCRNVRLRNVRVDKGDYIFMHGENIRIEDYAQRGNYSFQYCRNVVIRNAVINSKDAFWNTEDVTVYDSEINGEYLGWHSKRLRLVNCKISGTQPLCYATDLVLENCTMADDCDLAFEYSTLQAAIDGPVRSVKNPRSGSVTAESYGEVILDGNVKAPGDCRIATWDKQSNCA